MRRNYRAAVTGNPKGMQQFVDSSLRGARSGGKQGTRDKSGDKAASRVATSRVAASRVAASRVAASRVAPHSKVFA
jgi:hypothetical protein